MRTLWEKLVQHVGTKYGQYIRNELNIKIKVNLVTPVHSTEILASRATQEALVRTDQSIIQESHQEQTKILGT